MIKKPKFLLIPIVYILITFSVIFILDAETTAQITEEDHLIEALTALNFFIASVLCLIAFLSIKNIEGYTWLRRLSYLGLAGVLFLGAGEEISWGQRIFNIETPETIKQLNYQDELTVHNLSFFDELGIDITDLFNAFWLSFTLLIPLSAAVVSRLRNLYEKFIPIVPWVLGLLFFSNWLIAKLAGQVYRSGVSVRYIVHDIVETKESIYAFLFVVVAAYLLYEIKSTTKRKTSENNVSLG